MAYTFKIPFNPGIIGTHLLKKAPAAIFPCTTNTASYWYGGAQAIYQGVRRLGLQKGDIVLVPAYSCGSEVEPQDISANDVLCMAELLREWKITKEI